MILVEQVKVTEREILEVIVVAVDMVLLLQWLRQKYEALLFTSHMFSFQLSLCF